MSTPKLKVNRVPAGYPKEEIMELESAMYRINFNDCAVMAEGRPVRNYDELGAVATSEEFKDREFIKVTIIYELYVGG